MMMASLISYEIVCATPRRDPIKENFLFDDHPAIKIGYSPILRTTRRIIIENEKFNGTEVFGEISHKVIERNNAITGAK